MIEANNPEINVDELMDKIREEVARRQTPVSASSTSSITTVRSAVDFSKIEALVNNAESRAYVRTKWPDNLNRFPFNSSKKFQELALKVLEIIFKDQHEVNFNLLQAFRESQLINRQLIEQTATLQAQVSAMDNHVNAIAERVGAMDNRVNTITERVGTMDNRVNAITERVGAMDNHVNAIAERVGAMDNRVNAIAERVSARDNRINAIAERVGAMDNRVNVLDESVGARDNRINAIAQSVGAMDNRVNVLDESVGAMNNRVNVLDESVGAMNNRVNVLDESVGAMNNRVNAITERVGAIDERHIRDDKYLKNDLAQQKRLITLFLEEARQRLPKPFNQEQLQTLVNEEQHLLDAFYVAFEDQFRGSREKIIDRLKVYLPLIEEAKVDRQNSPILDVGCGRGEWLELLRDSGYTNRGIDINRVMVDQCQTRGLEVMEGNVISYLQTVPDNNLGAVTGFHIIEHLPLSVLMNFVTETIRVLKPGGLAIFETPNPKNLVVGACNFYSDPTHRSPIFPETLQFILEFQGLSNVQIMYLNPVEQSTLEKEALGLQTFHNWFFGPRDYAVVGYKV